MDRFPTPLPWTGKGEPLTGVSAPVVALTENTSIEEFPKLQTNRNLPAGSETMLARNPILVNPEATCVPGLSAPVEGLTGNAIIPFTLVEYRTSVVVSGFGLLLDEPPPHPKHTNDQRTERYALAAHQAFSLFIMSNV